MAKTNKGFRAKISEVEGHLRLAIAKALKSEGHDLAALEVS
jgi:hypothetical protein